MQKGFAALTLDGHVRPVPNEQLDHAQVVGRAAEFQRAALYGQQERSFAGVVRGIDSSKQRLSWKGRNEGQGMPRIEIPHLYRAVEQRHGQAPSRDIEAGGDFFHYACLVGEPGIEGERIERGAVSRGNRKGQGPRMRFDGSHAEPLPIGAQGDSRDAGQSGQPGPDVDPNIRETVPRRGACEAVLDIERPPMDN